MTPQTIRCAGEFGRAIRLRRKALGLTQAAFPISLSLPLRPEPYGDAARSVFANLLPEADVRARLCQQVKVTPGNDFEVLRRIGGECAGAPTISHEMPVDAFTVANCRPLDPTQFRRWSLAPARE